MASGMQGSLLLNLEGLISGQKTIIIKNRRRMPCGGMVDDGNEVSKLSDRNRKSIFYGQGSVSCTAYDSHIHG